MKIRKLKKALKRLEARQKDWENLDDSQRKAFRRPGAMKP
jgi:hypothetical protein